MSRCYFSTTSFLTSPSHTTTIPNYLNNKVSPPEVCNSPGQPCSAPHKTQEERSLRVGEGLHHFPEPLYQGSRWFNAFVSCYRFQEMKWDIWASTYLKNKIQCDRLYKSDQINYSWFVPSLPLKYLISFYTDKLSIQTFEMPCIVS